MYGLNLNGPWSEMNHSDQGPIFMTGACRNPCMMRHVNARTICRINADRQTHVDQQWIRGGLRLGAIHWIVEDLRSRGSHHRLQRQSAVDWNIMI